MAVGDITWFNEAKAFMLDGGWAAADDMKVALLDNTTAPTAATVTPALADFTQVGTAGTYVAGGTSIGSWGNLISQTSGTVTFDSATNPTWAKHASNDTDAFWALVYNDTQAGDPALCFVDLAGPKDMTAGALTINWHANGLATLT